MKFCGYIIRAGAIYVASAEGKFLFSEIKIQFTFLLAEPTKLALSNFKT